VDRFEVHSIINSNLDRLITIHGHAMWFNLIYFYDYVLCLTYILPYP